MLKTYNTSSNVLESIASSRQAARSARVCETRLFWTINFQTDIKNILWELALKLPSCEYQKTSLMIW